MALKAVIFDMDGVLIDSMTHHIAGWKKFLDEEKVNVTHEQLALNEGRSFKDTVDFFVKENGDKLTPKDIERISDKKKKHTMEFLKIVPYNGVREFVEHLLKKGIKTAIVTGSRREFAEKVVKNHFEGLFDFIISSDDVNRSKPYPDPYLKAVEFLKFKKEECLVIENAPLGIESAKEAGLKVYALQTTLDKKHLMQADKIFKNHEDMIKYVLDNI